MSDLNDMVPAFKRTLAPPGQFAELFPEATDTDIVGYIMDALAAAQLDRFLLDFEADALAETVTPDLSSGEALNVSGATVMLYAHWLALQAELRNRRNRVKYVATGGITFEEEQTASMLNELLRQTLFRIQELKRQRDRGELALTTFMADLNLIRSVEDYGKGVAIHSAWGW